VEGLKQADPQFRWLDANKNPRRKLRCISMSFRTQRGILSKISHFVRDDNKRSELRGERSEGSKPQEVEQNADLTERLDAFVSRFCRLQDTLGDKLLPIYLRMQLEPIGTVLDNLNRAEKLGLIPSVADWIEARTLRNNLVHEYTEDVDVLRQSILRALELIPMLETVTRRLSQESNKKT
jgi:uncharacterized protein with HEPN domain